MSDQSKGYEMVRVMVGLSLATAVWASPLAARPWPKTDVSPETSRPCPDMGEGFVRLAGSDTCIKLAGSVRVEVMKQSGGASSGR